MPKKNESLQKDIGRRIAKLRKEKNLKQDELAGQAGLSSNYLAQVEQGGKGIGSDSIVRLAKALDTTTDYLLLGQVRKDEAGRIEKLLSGLTEKERESYLKIIGTVFESFSKEESVSDAVPQEGCTPRKK